MANRIKTGDTVMVVAGDSKGTRAKVLRVDIENNKVVLEGVNVVTKHIRPSRVNPQGGRLRVERPINMSNVMPIDVKSGKATRVRSSVVKGKKVRVSVAGNQID